MRPFLTRFLVETPRWLFLGALVCAPWVYGTTPAWAIALLEWLLAIILLLWAAGCALRRLQPAIHPGLFASVAALLAYGWLMAANPHFQVTGIDRFVPRKSLFPFLPGTVDGTTSVLAMVRITCLLGILCFVCDLSMRRAWRRRIWFIMGLTGVSLVLFGLLQSAFARPLLVWKREDMTVPYFATYYYHGNAGAFINLVLPFVAGLAIMRLRKPESHMARAVWFPGVFICVAGAFVNVSRSAMVITVAMCVVMLVWQFRAQRRDQLLPPRRLRIAYALLMVGAIACLVAFSGWERPAQKWAALQSQFNLANKRLVSTKVCLRMLPDAGWHGFGPGTFSIVFPHYTSIDAAAIPGIWKYAHDDYLQTLLEWGWLGAAGWAVVFGGAAAQLYFHRRMRRRFSTGDRVLLFAAGLSLCGVAAHATVDFPLQIASLQLYTAVCLGLCWGMRYWSVQTPDQPPETAV
ncbi:MAG TPA: O-antigen ligase family protein [Chthoniobacteraceae bacterium]|jgi:hypothetical protein|nr:O-antigen ligase family protein [Chthoniobacteraceae bacterium]